MAQLGPASIFRFLALALLAACAQPTAAMRGPLVINEVMTDNDAAWIDEAGEVGDWVELGNVSQQAVQLERYALEDERGRSYRLPARALPAGALLVIFIDGDPEQGPLHADFKLSAQGVSLKLMDTQRGEAIDVVQVPPLALNQAYARLPGLHGSFAPCRYATPERDNGERCGPPATPELTDRSWPAFQWPAPWPASGSPLIVSELALRPARFIQVRNRTDAALDLRRFQLQVAATGPGQPWPSAAQGGLLDWGEPAELAAHATRLLPVTDAQLGALATDPGFEGVVSVFDAGGQALERVDFMRWPAGASLVRTGDDAQRFHFCEAPLADQPGARCTPLARRDVGDRVRHLYTPGDYDALAAGDVSLTTRGVKLVVDLQAGSAVHLLSSRAYALHYGFIREQIEHAPHLDRCDAAQGQAFTQGWIDFSQREYFRSQGRRYLLGTLDTYAGAGLTALDFSVGDAIVADQMQQAFFSALAHLDSEDPTRWSIHPTEPRQEAELALIAGRVPVVGANAPFRNLRYQPLSPGVAFGQLMFIPADELERASLGPDRIVVTDAVPNDIPFVSGLITEAFQTPLAHVNVLSQNRGTPNMGLRDARSDASLRALLGKLVRFEVSSAGYSLRAATSDEVAEFQKSRLPENVSTTPRLDTRLRGPVDLAGLGLADLPAIGAKAAQLAELGRVQVTGGACPGKLPLPATPFAIPLVHSLEHFEQSGAAAMLRDAEGQADFQADPARRAAVLAQMRAAILETPLAPELLEQVRTRVRERFGSTRLRFRSSSNTEDLPGFNGAGLYESWSGALDDPERPIEDAIRAVWASLWNARAYDERELGNIDQRGVAMGVLVHPAFLSERANVIVVSRDLQDPTRSDVHTMNAQAGEASVANPAPGVSTEELLHHVALIPGSPEVEYRRASSLTHGAQVLSVQDAQRVSCVVSGIVEHFRPLLDPEGKNRWFAMDVEVKLVGPDRRVVVKQARPLGFGRWERPADCREY